MPVTLALHEDRIYTAVDHKPKRTRLLQRLANIAADPRVTVLCDDYEDDWSQLWWCRLEGEARVVADGPDLADAARRLAARYEQYRAFPIVGPAIVIDVIAWTGWRA